ncbi:divalent-cation tolerance protein CutA [Endozoicomonas sp. G2_1]|uniref:divalent-cation tolerance protein CutA n=1 Tax=Endozoicomonas sp. G2_1 TaxID=2821091 RepID=UPI001ADC506D|nr:divalent-cation tolerance protein CutA [Endozoicomonas sp. G2_1]MBO9489659.1 divalent-cation tolerance protein CutA [Endozoicomonas sp. G2_1]
MTVSQYQMILCTCPNEDVARDIATGLVKEKLAACVNMIAGVTSVYMWQNEINQDREVQLLIKSQVHLFDDLVQYIEQKHPYDVPEVIAVNIQQGNNAYLNWINETLQ